MMFKFILSIPGLERIRKILRIRIRAKFYGSGSGSGSDPAHFGKFLQCPHEPYLCPLCPVTTQVSFHSVVFRVRVVPLPLEGFITVILSHH